MILISNSWFWIEDRVTKDADTVAIEAEQKAQEHEEKLRLLRRQEAKSAVVKDLEVFFLFVW